MKSSSQPLDVAVERMRWGICMSNVTGELIPTNTGRVRWVTPKDLPNHFVRMYASDNHRQYN